MELGDSDSNNLLLDRRFIIKDLFVNFVSGGKIYVRRTTYVYEDFRTLIAEL